MPIAPTHRFDGSTSALTPNLKPESSTRLHHDEEEGFFLNGRRIYARDCGDGSSLEMFDGERWAPVKVGSDDPYGSNPRLEIQVGKVDFYHHFFPDGHLGKLPRDAEGNEYLDIDVLIRWPENAA